MGVTVMAEYPGDYGFMYDRKRRQLGEQRDATLAQNAYSRMLAQQRGSRDLGMFDLDRTQGLSKFANFYQRGLGRSGILRRARNDYAQDWTIQRTAMQEAMQNQLRELDFADARARAQYDQGATDLDFQKLRDIMATAAQLQQLTGG